MNSEDASLPLSEQLNRLPESELVCRLREQYYRTGTYCIDDLYRILGDPNRIVDVKTEGGFTCGNLIM
jgi:hypothetical protein